MMTSNSGQPAVRQPGGNVDHFWAARRRQPKLIPEHYDHVTMFVRSSLTPSAIVAWRLQAMVSSAVRGRIEIPW